MQAGKKIYFASDFHLGVPNKEASLKREKKLVSWLDMVKTDAEEIHLMGDLFDFWFEYKQAVPRGFVRVLGKIAELCDSGIPIYLYKGNHDMWIFDYLPEELGVVLVDEPIIKEWNGKRFFLGHGDGLGPGDKGYKFIKKIFRSRFFQWCFARVHPNLGIGLANYWSRKSRGSHKKMAKEPSHFLGEENEWLVQFCQNKIKEEHFDFFVFGHRHLVIDFPINEKSRYINLGDWFTKANYTIFDGENMIQKVYE